jgi:hypothetical protein
MYGGDALLELTNRTGRVVVIDGYEKEPYLKFVPGDGVFENVHSPAVYYNSNRYARTTLPDEADATLQPEWRRVADGSRFAWHDHRVHWMSPVPPSPVFNDPGHDQKVLDWEFVVHVGDDLATARAVTVAGTLWWVAPVAWWPLLIAFGAVFLAITVMAVWRTTPVGERWPGLARTVVVLIWAVLAANVVRVIDDLAAVPAYRGGIAGIVATTTVSVLLIFLLTLHAWRGHVTGYLALLGAGLATTVLYGTGHSAVLSASQILTGLPMWVARWTVAASCMTIVPVVTACLFAGHHFLRWYRAHPVRFRSPRIREDATTG